MASSYLRYLYPANRTQLDQQSLNKIIEKLTSIENENDIEEFLVQFDEVPFQFIDIPLKSLPSAYDSARLYVLIDYLIFSAEKNSNFGLFDRKRSYLEFFDTNNKSQIKYLLAEVINAKTSPGFANFNIQVDVVKGGISKIKEYMLESDKLKLMRGASALIKYANIDITKDVMLNQLKLIPECIVYCNGGNAFLIAPKGYGEKICRLLEESYSKVLLGGKFAFEYVTTTLDKILFDYKKVSEEITSKLTRRQMLKIYPLYPKLLVNKIQIEGRKIKFEQTTSEGQGKVCTTCMLRDALYTEEEFSEQLNLCPVCYLKYVVGREVRSIFKEDYCKKEGVDFAHQIDSINDIGDDVGIIYGDGNNMGNVVMNIENIMQMTYFSRKVDSVTVSSVYEAIHRHLGHELRFEIIILGGDDILIVVPAEHALDIAYDIIRAFDSAFSNNITMSMGVLITKPNLPISSAFKIVSGLLKSAKRYVKQQKIETGSVDVEVLSAGRFEAFSSDEKVIFPCEVERLKKIKDSILDMKNKQISNSKLYTLKEAANQLLPEEFGLFYLYNKAKDKNLEIIDSSISKMIDNHKYTVVAGLAKDNQNRWFSPWNEIVDIWDSV